MRQKDTSALEIDTGLAMQDPHKKNMVSQSSAEQPEKGSQKFK